MQRAFFAVDDVILSGRGVRDAIVSRLRVVCRRSYVRMVRSVACVPPNWHGRRGAAADAPLVPRRRVGVADTLPIGDLRSPRPA